MAILRKMANLDGENCHMADHSNWMPLVAPWGVAILVIMAKMAILAKMAKFGKNSENAEGW